MLFVTSPSVTALQLSKLIGIEEAALTSRPSRDTSDDVYWRFEPADSNIVDLAAGIELLSSSIHVGENIRDIYLSIGVFYYSYTCTVSLSFPSMALLTTAFPDLVIDVSPYPCSPEDDEEETSP